MTRLKCWVFLLFGVLIGSLLFRSILAHAQVQPVDVGGGGISWPLVGIVLVIAGAILGFAYWRHHNPTQESAAMAQAHSDMAMVASKAHDSLNWAQQHLETLLHKLPEPAKIDAEGAPAAPDVSTPVPARQTATNGPELAVPAVPTGPTAEQLAAIAAAKRAYDEARLTAGLPPAT
jgi:hypothetical protein